MRLGSIARAAVRRTPLALAVALAFIGGIAVGRAAVAPEPERVAEWSIAAQLAQPRAFARAVALATGEILVLGGLDPTDPEVTNPTSELFDPTTGKVTLLPDRILGRLNQTVTVGWGDRVVVIGGTEWAGNHWEPVTRVDVYLPYSRAWLRARPMTHARSDHAATALPDGRIFVTGGNFRVRTVRESEIYDPARDEWTSARPLPVGRAQASAATLLDGRVLFFGGFQDDGKMPRTTLIYDPRRDEWTAGPDLHSERLNHVATRLPGGDLLLFGGERAGGGTAERYDVRLGRFEYAGSLREPRVVHQGTSVADGRVIAMGGLTPGNPRGGFRPLVTAEIWDPATRSWLDIADPPSARAWATVVATERGVFLISGSGDDERAFTSIEQLVWH